MTDDGDPTLERLDAIAAAVAEVGAAVERQAEDLRLALEVLVQLAQKLEDPAPGSDLAAGNGVEVGALMGATQAAWFRLEQRLESGLSDIDRQLRSLSRPSAPAPTTPAPALGSGQRPTATGDQLRRAASSFRESVRGLRRSRW
jgi:hypothetical protein